MNRIQPKIAVVIPVYKKLSEHSKSEKALIEQTKKVFKDRSLFFAGPESLSKSLEVYDRFDHISFGNEFFKDKFTYSRLLCSLQFYKSFSDYDFIQLIQTDCWLFEDKLDYFASSGFDYIGAPWMKNGFEGKPEPVLWKVGNGGFSLRKVTSFLSVINQIESTKKGTSPVFTNFVRGLVGTLKQRGIRNNLRHYIKNPPGEDIFWSIYVPMIFSENEFHVADTQTAAHYSFETLPQYLYEKVTNQNLPMGCHNWIGNNPEFWKDHITI